MNWILDADVSSFFDSVSHEWLIRFIEHRIGDQRIIRLIRKWLKVGVMEDGKVTPTEMGTPQGAVISPLLANIYLHYVFDLWANQWRCRHARGGSPVRKSRPPGSVQGVFRKEYSYRDNGRWGLEVRDPSGGVTWPLPMNCWTS